ncbi:TetR/AcrR family transcriptional regulator [Hoyosella sp. YIM 151337]|uniref:SACE_7040 family transcriptional regulator n=1 Tax=Hoyosella sp. YIM 151337 TaxID=2992742 RepID=UPI0022360AA9|nr:TetR/AcrR family transcriptional regulator [Hoyosella sp. YIM 151337]MCW4353644.1 TetR/AcrR family transcriptional regulator [Hoyosella sp. YIM 151337]
MQAAAEEPAPTRRSQMKADRRKQLLTAAAKLIAERGYNGVRLEDIGAEAGISGPAIYRHFPNKEALLVELLTGVSDHLFYGGSEVADRAANAEEALAGLIEFHLDFALNQSDLIRVQDRDLHSLPAQAQHQVRMLQRRYVERWVQVLMELTPSLDAVSARTKAHAVFGLINSTPHSARASAARTREILRNMARAALAS